MSLVAVLPMAAATGQSRSKNSAPFAVETPLLARQRSRFRAEVARARIAEIAGVRPYIFLTNPREVAKAIREFTP